MAVVTLSACATTPKGPSIVAWPSPWKPLEVFQADDAACRQWAAQQSGTSQNRYDYAYQQCMYAKGNEIPGLSPSRQAAPPLPAPPPSFAPGASILPAPGPQPRSQQVQPTGKPLTNDDIISFVRTGLSEAVIVSLIQKAPTRFDLGPEALTKLKEAGISNTVIEAMKGGGGRLPEESVQQPPLAQGLQAPPVQQPTTQGIVNTLLAAIAANDYDAFVGDATPVLKTRITKEEFKRVSTQLSPRLGKGYELRYLGSLKQQGVEVFLWKMIYKDAGNDMLARLVLQGDKVAGFWFE